MTSGARTPPPWVFRLYRLSGVLPACGRAPRIGGVDARAADGVEMLEVVVDVTGWRSFDAT